MIDVDDRDAIGADDFFQPKPDGLGEIAPVMFADEVSEDFGVGLRLELVTFGEESVFE